MARLRVFGSLSDTGYAESRLLYLNACSRETLEALFQQVCHSKRWISELSSAAPSFSLNDLQKKGAGAWSKCREPDWKEALQGHPRIGDKAKGAGLSAKWSAGEQSKAQSVDEQIAQKLREAQERYYQKFGFIFLIYATGKSSEEILASAEMRLNNSEAEELQIVAEEQAKIIHLRLEKLLIT
jgi:OHCU decarboxylase